MMRGLCFAVFALVVGVTTPALAQNNWPTPGGSVADGKVDMWINGSGQAVPTSAANPLPVNVVSGGGGGGAVTQATTPWVDNVSQFGGANVVTGTGVGGAGIPRVTVSSDSFPASQAVTGTFWPYALGQQLAAASVPVVLTAAQLSTLTPPPAIIGFALDTSVGTTNTDLGPPGATACATDTGTCSLNALLQRIAQRITSALGGTTVSGTVTANGAANVTATDCSGTVTSGGTAQNAFTAQTTLHGFTIANIDTTEPLWISFTTTAAAAGAGSYPLPAATATTYAGFGSFTAPPGFGLNHALSVIAATTSHKFTCTWW